MIRPFLALVFAGALLAACGGGNDCKDCGDQPDMSMTGARCTAPTTVPCTDESIQQLTLKKVASTRVITNTAETGGFASEIDATAGAGTGIDPKESYVYAKFTDAGLVTVPIGDEAAFTSMEWDLSFRRFVIRLNSGVSGPSCVDGARTPANTNFDTVTAVPSGLEYRTEAYFTATCDYIPDGSGLMSPGTALQSFWQYPGCVQMTDNVFIIRLADGRKVKLVVTHYYEQDAQDHCDATNMLEASDAGKSAHVGVRWAFVGG